MNYRFAFYISDKPRTRSWADILRAGAAIHGDVVEVVPQGAYTGPLASYDGAIQLGMARFCKRVMKDYLDAGKHFLYLDKGYMGSYKGEYFRGSLDAWQPLAYFQRVKRPDDRLIKTKYEIDHRRDICRGDKVLLAGACQNYSNFFDLGNVTEFNTRIVENLRRFTEREIVYRPNPSWARQHTEEFVPIPGTELSWYDTDFNTALREAHILVTHGTSAAVAAMARGIPVLVLGEGICKPLSQQADDWDNWDIEDPYFPRPRDRYQFFCDLAYCQWTREEWRSGEAWKELRLALSALSANSQPTSAADVIEQYKLMHASPRYFRGLSIVKYFARIGKIIIKTESRTLLDYGSGKGMQYLPPYELQKGWDVEVKCYDPAVPHLDVLPSRKYDGVVCCDVMEHVPEEEVLPTLKRIIGYGEKFVFLAICSSLANKVLPDGRNCHLTVRPESWWCEMIARARMELGYVEPSRGPIVKVEVTSRQDEDDGPTK